MVMPSAKEMEDMRGVAEETMESTCTIVQVTLTNNQGSWGESKSNRATGVSCRIGKAGGSGGREFVIGDGIAAVPADYVVTVPYDQVVEMTDEIIMDTGETYQVIGVERLHDLRTAANVFVREVE